MKRLCGFLIIGLLPAFFITGCEKKEAVVEGVRPVKAIKVGEVSGFGRDWFPGRAKATEEANLSFRVPGPLITRPVNVGDVVKKGDVLARIDPTDYNSKLREARGQLENGKAALTRAQADYERVTRIQADDPGAVSQTMLDRRLEGRDRAAANLKSLEAAVDFAKDQLGYTYLKAPWAGTVVATYVENFEDVRAKQQIFRLLDTSRIEFVIDVPEKMISYALNVTKIAIRFASFPGRDFPAEIKEIASEATEGTRTYPVTLIMDQQKDVKILPGMAGEALVEGSVPDRFGKEGIEVPPSAVFSPEDNQKTFVWVIDENTMTVGKREVQTGAMTMSGTIIREGVTPGEWVVTAGVHYLREGQEVKILSGSAWEGSQ